MRKNIFRNLFLCLALAFFAIVINVKGIHAAKVADEYSYGVTEGNIRFEMNTRYFQEGVSHLEVDLRVIALNDSELLTGLRVESKIGNAKATAAISGSTDEAIIEDFTVRVYSDREQAITFWYTTTLDSQESDKSIILKLDRFAPSFEDLAPVNTAATKTMVLDLEILEVNGLRKLEYLAVAEGETTIGKTWVTAKEYAHANEYDNIVERIEVNGLTDGKYDLYVRAFDYAGNTTGDVKVGTYTIDNTAPIFKSDVTVPADWTNNGEVTLPLATDGKLTYAVNGGTPIEYTSTTNVITLTTEGENNVVLTATDAAGNTVTKEFTLKLDITKPEVNATVTGGDASKGTGYTIEITATDATSNVAKIFYAIDGGEYQEYTTAIELPLSNTEREIAYYAVDNAGNESEIKTVETGSVDSLDVTVLLNKKLPEGIKFFPTDLEIEVVTKASVGILSIKYSEEKTPTVWNDVDLATKTFKVGANGKYKVKVETVVGTSAEATVEVKEIDKVAPTLENLVVEMLGNHATVKFDYSDDYSGVANIGVLVCSKASTDCELNGNHEPDFYKLIVVVEDRETVDLSEITNVSKITIYEFDEIENVEFDIEDDGEYEVQVMVTDYATNTSVMLSQLILSDGTAPVKANISRNIQDEVSQDDYVYTITGKATDALSGMKEEYVIIYTFDANGTRKQKAKFTDLSNAITINEEGKYEFYYAAVDNAGNVAEVSEIFIIDRTAPEFTVTFNVAKETWTNKLEMDIKASNIIDAETVKTIKWGYALEGQTVTLTETLEAFQKVELELGNGKYLFKVEVTDMCGNVGEYTSEVYYVDVVKPVITLNTELDNKLLGGLVEVNASLSDADSGIDKVSYSVFKGETLISESASVAAAATYSFNVPFAEEGHYEIVVKLTDKAGNVTEVKSGEFLVDLKAPVIEGLNDTGYHSTSVAITITDTTDVKVELNGEELPGTEFRIEESGYYQLTATDELGQKNVKLFVVNLRNELVLKNETIDVLTQRYLPIVKDGDDYYVNVPKGTYGLKNVLVFTAEKDGVQAKLDQEENYVYLKSNVNKAVVENGYKVKIKDASIITEEDENGYYGYVVVSAITTEEALNMDIEVVVIDNEGLALGLGVAGTVALVGLFFVSRGKKSLKV